MAMFGVETNIYSMDIDLSLLDEKAKEDPRICFLEGDSNNINAVFSSKMLATLPHPWLIIEDAHINLIGVLEYFHQTGLTSGDYLIVEDTNKFMWGLSIWDREIWEDWEDSKDSEKLLEGATKIDDLRSWLTNHSEEYLVDTYYQDIYGYNVSKNWNSIFKKV